MDKPQKPQTSDEEVPVPPPPAPSLQGRSPFRPLSRRRRSPQLAEPASAVERPETSLVFDASPTTVASALAKSGASAGEPARLAWDRGSDDPGIEVDPNPPSNAAA